MDLAEISAKAQILIRRPARDVYDAFANPAEMSKFWFSRVDGGLREGKAVTWSLGDQPDAPEFEVRVIALNPPTSIVMEWGCEESCTTVTWTFEQRGRATTLLRVEEAGFSGDTKETVSSALDSTGGFNQVIVAAKALLEHGVAINVVADRAAQ